MDLGFDDGTVVSYGDDGAALTITAPDGAAQPVADSPIVEQFRSLFNYGARAWIDSTFAPARPAAPAAGTAPGTAASNAVGEWRKYVPLVLLAAGAALVWRALR